MGEDSWKKRQNKCGNQKDRKINVEKKRLERMQNLKGRMKVHCKVGGEYGKLADW